MTEKPEEVHACPSCRFIVRRLVSGRWISSKPELRDLLERRIAHSLQPNHGCAIARQCSDQAESVLQLAVAALTFDPLTPTVGLPARLTTARMPRSGAELRQLAHSNEDDVPKLLEVETLRTYFHTTEGTVKAVDGITYHVSEGETVAIVGESGCGKSVGAMSILRLIPHPPGEILEGSTISFGGRDLLTMGDDEIRRVRGGQISMVFQEPMTSLNPVLTIGLQLTETMMLHLGLSQQGADQRAVELLGMVGIGEPERRLKQYPHHFSGGMRQRVMIALALSCKPRLIIADEPTTALDVTIQAQILELMRNLTKQMGVALIVITHNLGVVARYAERVIVMYAGKIVESGTADQIYHEPHHPYTIGLLNSVPRMDRHRGARLVPIEGQPPDLTRLDDGCAYRPRCRWAIDACARSIPPLEAVGADQVAACYRANEIHLDEASAA